MATGDELADKALEQAQHCLSDHLRELTELAAGDLDALRAAADRLRVTDMGVPELERTAQHIAFALVAAVFAQVAER